jgi:2-polyprenyl-3-methyl-5-hydroxy-6-metoxy-1,4-benzoquinol methylase
MIVNRDDFISEKCKAKQVIDLACVCHDLSDDQIKKGIWLHENIKQVAKSLIGFDIETEEIEKLKKKGYNIHFGDIEKIHEYTKEKFDVIVLGSCIEHLFNPGLMLDSIKKLCHSETLIVLSTVNAWAIRYFISAFIGDEARTCREDHVAWYSHFVLENLLRLKGFKVIEKHYYNFYPKKMVGIRPFFRRLQKKLMPFTCHGLIVTFKLTN